MLEISKQKDVEVYTRATDPRRAREPIIRANAKRIKFSIGAVRYMDLQKDTRLRFFQLGDQWFVAKDVTGDGFPLSDVYGKKGKNPSYFNGYVVNSTKICNQLRIMVDEDCILWEDKRYEYQGNKVYEIQKHLRSGKAHEKERGQSTNGSVKGG